MLAVRAMALAVIGLAVVGCDGHNHNSLPIPLYDQVQSPPPYRTTPGGLRLDNGDVTLDADGYRIDKNGQRVGIIDVVAKTAGQSSNPVAGFYISSIGANATGNVMAPSAGAGIGVGNGPGSASPTPSGGMGLPPTQPSPAPTANPSPSPRP